MAASATRRTDEVLAAARKDLESQLGVVREEVTRLAVEEEKLTRALQSLTGERPSSPRRTRRRSGARSRAPKRSAPPSSAATEGDGNRRRGGAARSSADRVEELRRLLVDGPKSRKDLAAALEVSPSRVQQLLAELDDAVFAVPDPHKRGKLWSIKATSGDGASAGKPNAKRGRKAKTAAAKPRASKTAASSQ